MIETGCTPTILKPCLACGEPSEQSRCADHQVKQYRNRGTRGYTSQWRRLSQRARKLQPFCIDCGTTENLTADHTVTAWARHEQGLPIRLIDIAVRCMRCNVKAGPARGANVTRDD